MEVGLGAIHRTVFLGLKGGKRGVAAGTEGVGRINSRHGGGPGRQRRCGTRGTVIGPVTEPQTTWGQEDLIHTTRVCYQVIDPWSQVRRTGA